MRRCRRRSRPRARRARRDRRAPASSLSSAPSCALRERGGSAGDDPLHHLGRRAERRRALGRVEHAEPARRARADVEQPAAGAKGGLGGARSPRRSARAASRRRAAPRWSSALHEVHDAERIGEVDLLRARVAALGDARIDDSLRSRRGRRTRGGPPGTLSIVSRAPSANLPVAVRHSQAIRSLRATTRSSRSLIDPRRRCRCTDADAQIIRGGAVRRCAIRSSGCRRGVGWQQGGLWSMARPASRWDFGDAGHYGASIERTITERRVGRRARHHVAPAARLSPDTSGTGATRGRRHGVRRRSASLHVASGRGLHSVLELGLRARRSTPASASVEAADELRPVARDVDFAFVFGTASATRSRATFQVDVVQDLATSLHQKTGLERWRETERAHLRHAPRRALRTRQLTAVTTSAHIEVGD